MAMKIKLGSKFYEVKCPVCGRAPVAPLSPQVFIVDDPTNPSPDKIQTGSPARCTSDGCGFIFIMPNHPTVQGPPNPSQN